MKVSIRQDFIKRKRLDYIYPLWVYYKAIYVNKTSTDDERLVAQSYLTYLSNEISPIVSCINYSVVSGGSRSVMRKFGRNRHVVRDMARRGILPGYYKAVW